MKFGRDLKALAAAERRDLADYVADLSATEWELPSLCSGWTVRDVVAHVPAYDELSWPDVLKLMARSRFSLARSNAELLARSRRLGRGDLVTRLRTHAVRRGFITLFGSAIALTDAMVHHQDIRRALGHPRTVPEDRLVAVLNFLPYARALPAPANVRNLRLVASDLDWTHGNGPEVVGPGEALVVALVGRPDALRELSGHGVATLKRRLAAEA